MWRARWVGSRLLPPLAAVAAVVGVWQLVSASGFFDPVVLPSPAAVWRALLHHVADGTIPRATRASLLRLGAGFALSVGAGTALGLLMAWSRGAARSVGSLVVGLQSLPSIAWLPLAILWFGLNESAVVFVVVIGSLPSVALATRAAVGQVPPVLTRAARTLGAKGWRLYGRVVLPGAVPGYLGGLQQAWAFSWRSLMAAELIASGALGLGQLMDASREALDTPTVLAVMVVIVAIGMVVDLAVFGSLTHRVRRRRGLLEPA